MKEFRIKRKYRDITIPYPYCYYKKGLSGYIYKDQFYSNDELNDLFNDFVGFYLNYHIEVNSKIEIVHSLDGVMELLLDNYNNFKIPNEYKDDFSEDEYQQIMKIQKGLKENTKIKKQTEIIVDSKKIKHRRKIIDSMKNYHFYKTLKEMKNYQFSIPERVYSKYYKRHFYAVEGEVYWNLLTAFEDLYNIGFYYQYCGDGIDKFSDHYHSHEFEYVISDAINKSNEFQIYGFQKQFFSKQEINFLESLVQKLKDISYHPIEDDLYKGSLALEYNKLCDEGKVIKAFLCDKKINRDIKRIKKEKLKNHKIKF